MGVSRWLILIGIVFLVLGLLWPILEKWGLGRLPGDVVYEKENVRFYFPIVTTIIISIVVSLILWFFRK